MLAQNLYHAEQIREHEAPVANACGCELFTLMQRAGAAVYACCESSFPAVQSFAIVVGSGNNAGDGFVVALLAHQAGKQVTVLAADPARQLRGDAGKAQQQWFAAGGAVVPFDPSYLCEAQVIVDALLGTGASGCPQGAFAAMINAMNASGLPIVSVDVPSGLNATTGQVYEPCVQAHTTVTFIAKKTGQMTGMGKQVCGQLVLADLGIGETFAASISPAARLVERQHIKRLPSRALHSHKGTYGRLLCVGGNQGMGGAIRLASEAALRSGAGMVKAFVHADAALQVAVGRPEIMVITTQLEQALDWATAIVLGPGLGQDLWAHEVLQTVIHHVQHSPKPILIDADGLNLCAHLSALSLPCQVVMTPHTMEAARLLGVTREQIEADRYLSAQQCAHRWRSVVVLKGAGSLITNGEQMQVSAAGNPALATAGSGDVLSGVVGALLAQGLPAMDAAVAAVIAHASAADEIAAKYGHYGMIASDLLPEIRKIINYYATAPS